MVLDLGRCLSVTRPYAHGLPDCLGGGRAYTNSPMLIALCSRPAVLSYWTLLALHLVLISSVTVSLLIAVGASRWSGVGSVVRVRRFTIRWAGE